MEIIDAQKEIEKILGSQGFVEYKVRKKLYCAGLHYQSYDLVLVYGNSWEEVIQKARME